VELLHARCGHRRAAATAGAEPGAIDTAPVRADDDQPVGRPRTDHAGDDVADRIGALLQPRRVRPGYARCRVDAGAGRKEIADAAGGGHDRGPTDRRAILPTQVAVYVGPACPAVRGVPHARDVVVGERGDDLIRIVRV